MNLRSFFKSTVFLERFFTLNTYQGTFTRKEPDTVRSLSAGQQAQRPSPIVYNGARLLFSGVLLAGQEASDGVRPLS